MDRQVVDRLIAIGDIIEQEYGKQIDDLLSRLGVVSSPMETLHRIAKWYDHQLNFTYYYYFPHK